MKITYLCKIICNVSDGAIVVVDGSNVDVGVPCNYPLRVVVVYEDLVDVALAEEFDARLWPEAQAEACPEAAGRQLAGVGR